MRTFASVVVVGLVAALPAVGLEDPPQPVPLIEDVIQPLPDPAANYKAPNANGAVVELLDEGVAPLFPLFTNDGGGEPGTITTEDHDVFAGVEAVRVTPTQRYRAHI